MPKQYPVESLDFLKHDPAPAGAVAGADPSDVLPQDVADRLLEIDGVDGAWIERDARGQREVVVYMSRPGDPGGVPSRVAGLVTRIVRGGPIRAGF